MRLEPTSQPLQNSHYNTSNTVERKPVAQEGNLVEQRPIINTKEVDTVVKQLNEFVKPTQTNLKFELHEKLNEYYVTVVNPITDEIIKEIPPKKLLDMYAEMAEFMGFLVDEKI